MSIQFFCPSGHRFTVDDSRAGQKVRCGLCKKTMVVPALTGTKQAGKPAGADGARAAGAFTRPGVPPPLPSNGSAVKEGLPSDSGPKPPPLPAKVIAEPSPLPPAVQPEPAAIVAPVLPQHAAPKQGKRSSRRRRRKSRRPAAATDRQSSTSKDGALQSPERPGQGRRRPQIVPPDAYWPDASKVAMVRWLAGLLALVVLFSVAPVFVTKNLNLTAAPGWARWAMLLAALQALYIAWMFAAPDWASVWVVMLVFAAVASAYGAAAAIALATPLDKEMLLGMGDVRNSAASWCAAVVLVMSLATYLCGRTSARWRRAYELEMAHRRGAPSSSTGSPPE